MSRIFIMCQGKQSRMKGLLIDGKPCVKQFLRVNGKRIIDRTIEMVKERTNDQIIVVASDTLEWQETCKKNSVQLYTQEKPEPYITNGIKQLQPLWNDEGTTTILLGDVVFSEGVLDVALIERGFVGRKGPNHVTKCAWGEIFSFSFPVDWHFPLSLAVHNLYGKLWDLHRKTQFKFNEVDDYTDDIDNERDLRAIPLLEAAMK